MSSREKVGIQAAMLTTEVGKEALKQTGSSSKKTDEGNFSKEAMFGKAIWHFRAVLFPRGRASLWLGWQAWRTEQIH